MDNDFATGDHPRVCGEKPFPAPLVGFRWGSPPRVRGKGDSGMMRVHRLGITPACAGKRKACK